MWRDERERSPRLTSSMTTGDQDQEVAGVDADGRPDADVRKLAALDHRVDRRAADAEPLGHLADGEELLREHDARGALEPVPRCVFGGP
jgi:hypothetical protein